MPARVAGPLELQQPPEEGPSGGVIDGAAHWWGGEGGDSREFGLGGWGGNPGGGAGVPEIGGRAGRIGWWEKVFDLGQDRDGLGLCGVDVLSGLRLPGLVTGGEDLGTVFKGEFGETGWTEVFADGKRLELCEEFLIGLLVCPAPCAGVFSPLLAGVVRSELGSPVKLHVHVAETLASEAAPTDVDESAAWGVPRVTVATQELRAKHGGKGVRGGRSWWLAWSAGGVEMSVTMASAGDIVLCRRRR